jgi:quercetin dioxygenase-like cupin family protein
MPKRLVTGQRADGTSYFVGVDELEQDFRGIGSYRAWAVDDISALTVPYAGEDLPFDTSLRAGELQSALRTSWPHPRASGQYRISIQTFDAGGEGHAFMHWHDTFDLQWLIAGSLAITLDDGEEVELRPGDLVIQHGTNHSWRAGPDGATAAIFIFGAARDGVSPPEDARLDTSKWAAALVADDGAVTGPEHHWPKTPVSELLERTPRRIVTGQRADGTSIFARIEDAVEDSRADAGTRERGVVAHRMWANDAIVPLKLPYLDGAVPLASGPSADETPEALRTSSGHAGPGGLRVSLIKFLPHEDGRSFGLHWHDTVDVQLVLAGELTIGLDDGSEQTMRAGDLVVQHGTNHSWCIGPEGAVVGLVMLGVTRDGLAPPETNRVDHSPANASGTVPPAPPAA